MSTTSSALNVDAAVRERYSAAATAAEASLCCSVDYDTRYLEAIPQEVIDRDYGCGDPSQFVSEGETVLDLGSGGGKICFIASQIVGRAGSVIGVDCNDEMLALARGNQPKVAENVGYDNISFRKGRIQDLQLNLDLLDARLKEEPVESASDWLIAQETARELRQTHPLVESDSVDVVVSNCVLNLVTPEDRKQLFGEVFRVLKPGGRAVISDIVSNRPVPVELQNDPELWSGCVSGAFEEFEFLSAFADAGFFGIEIVTRSDQPWATIEGIEFRSVTVRAWKRNEQPATDRDREVIYRGPWRSVIDDHGRRLLRGQRVSVNETDFAMYTSKPYAGQVVACDATDESAQPLDVLETNCCAPGTACC